MTYATIPSVTIPSITTPSVAIPSVTITFVTINGINYVTKFSFRYSYYYLLLNLSD